MKKFCLKHKNDLCNYFIDLSEKFHNDVRRDTRQIIFLRRDKRLIPLIIITILGVTVVFGFTAYAASRTALYEMRNELTTNYELLEKSYIVSEKSNNVTLNTIAELEFHMETMRTNLTETINRNRFFQDSILVILFALRAHDYLHSKLLRFFLGNMKQKAYSLTDFDLLSDQIAKINANLSADYFLPEINSPELINLLKFTSTNNNTDLIYKIHVPVLQRKQLNLFEIVPIPFLVDEDLMMVNIENSILIKDKNKIFSLTDIDMEKYCKYLLNFTICNSLITDLMTEPKPCISDIFLYKSDKDCLYSPIEKKMYLIKI